MLNRCYYLVRTVNLYSGKRSTPSVPSPGSRPDPHQSAEGYQTSFSVVLVAVVLVAVVLATVTAGSAMAAPSVQSAPTCGTGSTGSASPATAGAASSGSNVSVTVWTAPRGTFGSVQNVSQVHGAMDDGWMTPASAGATENAARGDVVAFRVNVSGDARTVLADLAVTDGTSTEERFVDVIGDPELRDEGFDMTLRTEGMCRRYLDWERTADQGALNVVIDRSNASIYVAIDPNNAVYGDTSGWSDYTHVWVQAPGSAEPREAGVIDLEHRELSLAGGDRAELPSSTQARFEGTTTVAPGTRLEFHVTAIVENFTTRVETRVARDGTFATRVNLSAVPPGTTLNVYPVNAEMTVGWIDVVAPPPTSTPSSTPTLTPSQTPTPAPTLTPTPTPAQTPTPSPTPTPGSTWTTVPGVGPIGALVALLAAAVREFIGGVSDGIR